jgi:hypothetical protein
MFDSQKLCSAWVKIEMRDDIRAVPIGWTRSVGLSRLISLSRELGIMSFMGEQGLSEDLDVGILVPPAIWRGSDIFAGRPGRSRETQLLLELLTAPGGYTLGRMGSVWIGFPIRSMLRCRRTARRHSESMQDSMALQTPRRSNDIQRGLANFLFLFSCFFARSELSMFAADDALCDRLNASG